MLNVNNKKETEINKCEVIFKANDLVQKMWHTMGIREQQIFSLLVRQIRPYDTEFKKQKFTFSEIANELGWSEGGNTRRCLMECLRKLGSICFWHRTPYDSNKIMLCRVLESAALIDLKENTVEMKLDDTLKPYLIGLQERGNMMITRFEYIKAANSQFTLRLYEYLRSKAFMRLSWQEKLTLEEIKELLNIKPTQPWGNLKRDALDKVAEEINKITDMIVKYEPNKVGKSIVSVTFYCRRKRNSQDKEEFDEQVNKESFENIYDDEREDLCSDLPDSYYDEYIAFEGFDDDNMEIEEFDD